jgi:hypothetical protein
MSVDITEAIETINQLLLEEVAKKVETVAKHYVDIIVLKDREIEFLKQAIMQSAIDFKRLQERTNGDKSCCQSSTSNS